MDHRDLDTLNNRRYNLRLASQSQNQQNKAVQKNNALGIKGVYASLSRYCARIHVNGKLKHLGSFDTAEDAHSAYVTAAQEHFGEFAHA